MDRNGKDGCKDDSQRVFDNHVMERSIYVAHNIYKVDYCSKHKLTLISRTVVSNFCGGLADTIINQQLSFLSTVTVWKRPLKGGVPCLKQRLEKSHQLDLSPTYLLDGQGYVSAVCTCCFACCAVVACGCGGLGFMQESNRKKKIAASYCLELCQTNILSENPESNRN